LLLSVLSRLKGACFKQVQQQLGKQQQQQIQMLEVLKQVMALQLGFLAQMAMG
jgi:hypothetical protein